tara:strand:+ start:1500 stop:2243 length:744 start_codon:yes stop_codon:yes gene_type:complete
MTIINEKIYSINFDPKKRNKKSIKFLIIHYTGMKIQKEAINRLTQIQSQVSTHYFIKNDGKIVLMVPEQFTAWHAGVSKWKNFNSLNKYSIGIEINNPGHQFGYKNFKKKQLVSIIKLAKYLVKKYNIKPSHILGHSDIAPFRKKDPGEKFPWKLLAKNKIGLWHNIKASYLKKNRKIKVNEIEKELFLSNIKKIGYSNKFNNNQGLKKKNFFVIKAFQRRFRQDLIDGKPDKECYIISKKLVKIWD